MKARTLLALAAVAVMVSGSLYAAEKAKAKKLNLKGIKCVLNPKAKAKADKSVKYKGGKVFFCCGNCPKAFAKNTKKHATSANTQLIATHQAKQAKCPLSGGKLNKKSFLVINKAKVYFCCFNCRKAVNKLKGKAQAEKVFSDKAFAKAKFTVGKKKKAKKAKKAA